jgi:TRAP-type C4-dicarboxylate transport system permease small subunit
MTELSLVARIVVGTVFLLSAAGKMANFPAFSRGVEEYRILPSSMARSASVLIIAIEGWLALAHVSGWWLGLAVPVGMGTFCAFAVAVAVNLHRGRRLPCYCFDTKGDEVISGLTLLRIFLLFSVELFIVSNRIRLKDSWTWLDHAGNPGFAEFGWAFFWATFLLVAFSWLLSWPDLTDLLTRVARSNGSDFSGGHSLKIAGASELVHEEPEGNRDQKG